MTKNNQLNKRVFLSFDIEEFDMPHEYAKEISFHEQIKISTDGCRSILDLLEKHQVRATFFSTVVFAQNAPDIIKRITEDGHELASHGFYHSAFEVEHLLESRIELEKISGLKILGYRMARMMPVSSEDIELAGYHYNSSLNPVYLPGRYNNYFKSRRYFYSNNLLEIPASATPLIRIPLFWLSFHNLPVALYRLLCWLTMKADDYLNLYFHPWEFAEIKDPKYGLPAFTTRRTGMEMVEAFDQWIAWAKAQNYTFDVLRNIV
jgi:peptidoglycan/xylan/chitin deacetylase (PgdA/CDA1 family)